MGIGYYVAVSAALSIVSAIFFHFWGDHVYPGLGFAFTGFMVCAASLVFTSGRFEKVVSIMAVGLLLVSVGSGILPSDDSLGVLGAIASVPCAIVAGIAVMANPFDSRTYDLRAKLGVITATTLPVVGLMIAVRYLGPAPHPFGFYAMLVIASALLTLALVPSNRPIQEGRSRQSA